MNDDFDFGRLLVLTHADWCGPSAITETLDARANRRPYDTVALGAGEPVPGLTPDVRGILVMGGPQGVPRADETTFMRDELELLTTAVDAGVPVFGICLGSQLLAAALGGEVRPRGAPEIGVLPLTRTDAVEDDEVFAGWPDGASQVFVHDDEISTLPDGAVQMLQGSDGIAAWRAADGWSYGVQFHPELTGPQFAAWAELEGFPDRAERAGVDLGEFTDHVQRHTRFTRPIGVSMVGRWLDGVVGRDDPTPKRRKRGD